MENNFVNAKTDPKNSKPKVKKGKRKSNPTAWKSNVRKVAIQHGKSYTRDDGTIAPAKTVGDYCQNCRMKCPNRISPEIRQQFFDRYYNIASLSEKRQFLLRYVQTVDVKRHRATESNRKFSRTYYIGTGYWENGIESRIQVCQVTFLNTLSISNKVLRAAYERMRSSNGTSLEDLRGRFIRKSSEDVTEKQMTLVKDHIKAFPLVDDFIPRMYDLYCDHMRKQSAKPELFVTIETYKEVYDRERQLKMHVTPTKKGTTTKKTTQIIEVITTQSHIEHKPQNIMTLDQYNETIGHHSYFERTWMGSGSGETKVGYVSYQIPVVKIEVQEHETIEPPKKKRKTKKTPEEIEKAKKSHSKKSNSDPSTWAVNRRKNANLHGLSYTKSDGTVVPAKAMKGFCQNCRLNCESKLDDDLRQQFFDRYYRLSSIKEKYQFILRYTQTVDIKSRRTENSKRKISRLYYIGTGFWDNGSETRIQVCQTLFLNTLCVSGKLVRTAYEKLWSTNGTSFEDLRGAYHRIKTDNPNKAPKAKRKAKQKPNMTEEDFSTAKILANM